MYHPYFRGKQFELLTIRESATILQAAGFTPIIEPVKESLGGLQRCINAIIEADGSVVIICNPISGEIPVSPESILKFIQKEFADSDNVVVGILLSEGITLDRTLKLIQIWDNKQIALVHAGFSSARELAEAIHEKIPETKNIFMEEASGKLYQRHFKGSTRILLRDGFQRRINRKHPPVEFFSDLHATYTDEGMDGFGDFLIVGDEYSESGGPAYAVAIHLTFIDSDNDDEMHIHHFKSVRQDDPKDPAGKFAEALKDLVTEVNDPDTKIHRTSAISEFLDFHKRKHFPGLGYVKKLSMKHHIETLAQYFSNT